MKAEHVIKTLPDGTQFQAVLRWDGYLTIDRKTAKLLSITGKVPKVGYEVKTKFVWPSIGMLDSRIAWLGWTTYSGKTELYLS